MGYGALASGTDQAPAYFSSNPGEALWLTRHIGRAAGGHFPQRE
jgi:hypothetical protein